MVKELKQLEYINSFLILFNAQNPRLDESLRAMVDIFTQIFGRERFFDNVILVFTRWEHSARAERKRQRTGTEFTKLMIRGDQRGGSQVNWKNTKIWISLPLLSQLFLKYAYTLDVLIHQYVHKKISDGTLPILLNFWKIILSMNLI